MAIALGDDDEAGAVARIKLAGVLGEVGELRRAEVACGKVLEGTFPSVIRGLALDTLISVLQALGRKEEARAALAELSSMEGGQLPTAAAFRQGQLHRLDGRLTDAEVSLARVFDALGDLPGALAGLGAARGELGQLHGRDRTVWGGSRGTAGLRTGFPGSAGAGRSHSGDGRGWGAAVAGCTG
jgi:hypothetical protein